MRRSRRSGSQLHRRRRFSVENLTVQRSTNFFVDIYESLRSLVIMSAESIRPTEAELKILAVLWEHGPSTVREIYARLGGESGYTTVLKFMQIMTAKGLLTRVER